MKIFFHQHFETEQIPDEDLTKFNLRESLEKTRIALEIAYAGFDNAVEDDLIDSYIYEINSLLKRYQHLNTLADKQQAEVPCLLQRHSPMRALVSHVFG